MPNGNGGRPEEVVVVTGASAGLGRAIVERFARDGAAIGLIARGKDRLEQAKASVESLGGRALVLPLDVADADCARLPSPYPLASELPVRSVLRCCVEALCVDAR